MSLNITVLWHLMEVLGQAWIHLNYFTFTEFMGRKAREGGRRGGRGMGGRERRL